MESNQTTLALEIPVPDTCPGCDAAWEEGLCPRCGLTRTDIEGILRRGCMGYEAARTAALAGDFRAARLHLLAVRGCGIAALAEHPAIIRLSSLCAEPAAPEVPEPPEVFPAQPPSTVVPSWLVPLAVGGGISGLVAVCLAVLALLFAIAAFVLALIGLLRH